MTSYLTDEAISLINKEVNKKLLKYAAFVGVGSLSAIAAGIFAIYTSMRSATNAAILELNKSAEIQIDEKVSILVAQKTAVVDAQVMELSDQVTGLGETILEVAKNSGAVENDLKNASERADRATKTAEALLRDLETLGNFGNVNYAALADLVEGLKSDGRISIVSQLASLSSDLNQLSSSVTGLESNFSSQASDLRKMIESNRQYMGNQKMTMISKTYSCDAKSNETLLPCPKGFSNLGMVLYNTWSGGSCGAGRVYNICRQN